MDSPDYQRLEITAELFKALGHPVRLAMLEKLKASPWCVCELADALGINKSVASKHLSLLYAVGVLDMEKRGTQVVYRLLAPCVVEMASCSYRAVLEHRLHRLGQAVQPEQQSLKQFPTA